MARPNLLTQNNIKEKINDQISDFFLLLLKKIKTMCTMTCSNKYQGKEQDLNSPVKEKYGFDIL